MSPPMHRILDANDGIAKWARFAIANTLRKETCIQVKCIEMGKKEMLAAVKDVPKTHKFSVRVDHKYIDYQMKSADNDDMTDFELEDMQAMDTAFTEEYAAKAKELADWICAPERAFPPVKRIDLYVLFHSYALLDSKPVLAVCVKCTG